MCERVNKDIDSGLIEHDFHKNTDLSIGSVINHVTNGYRFTENGKEEEFYKLKECINEMIKGFSDLTVTAAFIVPILRKMPYFGPKFHHTVDQFNQIFAFVDKVIDQHKQQTDYKTLNEPRDFIDAFLIEKERADGTGEVHYFS